VDRFDIIGWDPRGTGYSDPAVDCIDDYDKFFGLDSSPDTPEERQALVDAGTEFGKDCSANNRNLLPFLSTEDSARDMDAIREALGEEQISYFGFSYGSELGATWATMFPDTVRAMVIDGAVDPTVDYLHQNIQQAAGFEGTFSTFLAQCSATPSCAFYNNGDAEGAYDALSERIDANPVTVSSDRTEVTQGVLQTAVSQAMYDQSYWPRLEQALADLELGDGQGTLDLYDEYYGYDGSGWDNSLEAYFAQAPAITITGKGAGPILVMGTTGDPATPLQSTRNMADALEDGHLVVVTADQHTGYGVSTCGDNAVDDYLVDPSAPLEQELTCK
jgi:pimeloyl-ACP methyl ester carboxylesterase